MFAPVTPQGTVTVGVGHTFGMFCPVRTSTPVPDTATVRSSKMPGRPEGCHMKALEAVLGARSEMEILPTDRFLHRPESGLCRLKCPHRTTVTAETMENLAFRKGNVSTFRTYKVTISSRVQQHEVVDQNTVRATRLFDHGWLLGGRLAQKQSDLTLELLKQCTDAILRSTSSTACRTAHRRF